VHLVWSLIVSVVWAVVSAHLFLQGLLALAGFFFGVRGLGRIAKSDSFTVIGVSLLSVALFGGLLFIGGWFRSSLLGLGTSGPERVVYWLVAAVWVVGSLPQVPAKLAKSWRNSTVPGSLEEDALARRLRSP
jgi:hypothetical protein